MLKIIFDFGMIFPPEVASFCSFYADYDSINPNLKSFSSSVGNYIPENQLHILSARFVGKKSVSDSVFLKLLLDSGVRPANFYQLLIFGHRHQRYPISGPLIALADRWCHGQQGTAVPYIGKNHHERYLGLHYVEDRFEPHERFLVVPK